jgi:hypothetical protein
MSYLSLSYFWRSRAFCASSHFFSKPVDRSAVSPVLTSPPSLPRFRACAHAQLLTDTVPPIPWRNAEAVLRVRTLVHRALRALLSLLGRLGVSFGESWNPGFLVSASRIASRDASPDAHECTRRRRAKSDAKLTVRNCAAGSFHRSTSFSSAFMAVSSARLSLASFTPCEQKRSRGKI